MIVVLTGDVVESRSVNPNIWMPELEAALSHFSKKYDIYRGDSFQAEVSLNDAFISVFYVKAAMRSVKLDVRVGIGIGHKEVDNIRVKNTFGTALLRSGEAFDSLKKDTILTRSGNEGFDEMCNVMLLLAAELCARWTPTVAVTMRAALLSEEINQKELAIQLNKKHQSQVSRELQRAGFAKLKNAIEYCTKKLSEI